VAGSAGKTQGRAMRTNTKGTAAGNRLQHAVQRAVEAGYGATMRDLSRKESREEQAQRRVKPARGSRSRRREQRSAPAACKYLALIVWYEVRLGMGRVASKGSCMHGATAGPRERERAALHSPRASTRHRPHPVFHAMSWLLGLGESLCGTADSRDQNRPSTLAAPARTSRKLAQKPSWELLGQPAPITRCCSLSRKLRCQLGPPTWSLSMRPSLWRGHQSPISPAAAPTCLHQRHISSPSPCAIMPSPGTYAKMIAAYVSLHIAPYR
jgi:hypothetical protein